MNKNQTEIPTVKPMNDSTTDEKPGTSNSEESNRIKTQNDPQDENILKTRKPSKRNEMEEIKKYMSNLSKIIISRYDGESKGLAAFVAVIQLAETITTDAQQEISVQYIRTKLEGKALEAIPADASTAREIITALKHKIKPETSKVVLGRFLALRTERNALPKFQKEAEELANQLRRAYTSEGMTERLAETTTIDKTVEMCRLSAKSSLVKSILASTHFYDPKEVLAKLVTETTTESTEAQVMYFDRNNGANRRNFRGNGNYRGNGQNGNRNGYRNQNFNRNSNSPRQQNNFRGRGNYRGNNRNWRQQHDNRRRQNSNRVYFAENYDAPPSGAPQQPQQVTLRQEKDRRQ